MGTQHIETPGPQQISFKREAYSEKHLEEKSQAT